MSCCDVNGLDRMFRGRAVEREQQRFLNKGPEPRQRRFLEGLELSGAQVLDVGAGIGALGLTALQSGAAQATFVDVSRAYQRAARELAERSGYGERARFVLGDFAALELPDADLVVLDRVVCCYPEGPGLLEKAARQSRRDLVFSYPKPTWYLRLGRTLVNGVLGLFRNPYRFFLHDERALLEAAASAGHTLTDSKRTGVWSVRVFKKVAGRQKSA